MCKLIITAQNINMNTITKEIDIYNYEELSYEAKETAITEYINYLQGIDWNTEEYTPDYIEEAIKKAEELKTPWFFGNLIYELGKDKIELELKDFDYLKNEKQYN